MNTILPNYQRTHSSMASRKRVAAEVAKKPKPVFPTSHSPHPSTSHVERMSIADSAILRASLTQSRHNWTHNAFTKFTPEPAVRTLGQQGGKRYISEVTPAGVYTVCIGPHMFFETKFFTVYTPPPPTLPAPASTSPEAPLPAGGGGVSAGDTAASTPTELPSSPTHMIPGGSPAPERVIELILARTSTPTPFEEDGRDTDGAKSLPSELAGQRELETSLMESIQTLEPVVMDSNKNNIAHIHGGASGTAGASGESSSRAGTPSLTGSGVGGSSLGKKPAVAGQTPKPPRPERQVAFEFKDNPGHRWLFPQEASVDFTPAGEGSEYGKISASFCLTVFDDSKTPVPPGQMTTMVIVGPSQSLYEGILAAVNDPTVTYKALMDKMKQIPPRAYPEYQLPVDYPDEKLEPLGLKKLPDHKVVPLASLQPSKRKPDGHHDIPVAKQRRPNRMGVGAEESTATRSSGSQKKTATPSTPTSTSLASGSTASGSSILTTKRCVYCGCTTTPMWRRGPAGPSTLCNACGVKWKNGKILQETPKPPSSKSRQQQQQHYASTFAGGSTTAAQASSTATKAVMSNTTAPSTRATNSVANTSAAGLAASGSTAGGPQKTTVEAAAELLKNFVEAVNNPRQNGVGAGSSQPMSRSSSVRGGGGSGGSKRSTGGAATATHTPKRDASQMSESSMASESEGSRISEAEKMVPVKKRHSTKAQAAATSSLATNASSAPGPKLVPVAQIGEQVQKSTKSATAAATTTGAVKERTPSQTGSASKSAKANSAGGSTTTPAATAISSANSTATKEVGSVSSPSSNATSPTTTASASTTTSATNSPTVTVVTPSPASPLTATTGITTNTVTTTPTATTTTTTTTSAATTTTAVSKGKAPGTSKTAGGASASTSGASSRGAGNKVSGSMLTFSSVPLSAMTLPGTRSAAGVKGKANGATTGASAGASTGAAGSAGSTATVGPTGTRSSPTSAGAKLELLKALASSPRYQISHAAAVSTMNLADDGLSLFATKNLYTNNTATFPLHFPTISIAFGPNNAYYTYPNCAVILYENHFQIKLIQGGERTQIDVWKEGIEGTEFQVVDVGDGESMIVFRAVLRQYMTRFDKELLNPDRNETLIVFRFRERLDGGGPPVKPLLEQWLTTEIPVPPLPTSSSSTTTSAATSPSPSLSVATPQTQLAQVVTSKPSPMSSPSSSSTASTPAKAP